ncbi:DUF4199 domain-containing protein [Portibacter lacus]|uniref:DUF4199 domain-containing protein n=1 Tax=Portibacter lacus TaxID=1099794 RepID=A0AA37SLI0_9BACT|nr:DUF4199 domain-containing protein [Portibacter lacus]GLR16673.1 hypothetical protein GCM10007940_12880 [Portibacter lacus]
MTPPVKYGLFFFLVSSGITLVQFLVAKESMFSPVLGMVLSIGLSILFIVLSIRADRDNEPGYTMAEGIKAGMITYGIGTLLSMAFMYVLANFIDPSLGDTAIELSKEIAAKTAETVANFGGLDEAQKAEMLSEMENQEIPNPFSIVQLGIGWVVSLIFPGLIISLIAAAIMKKN